MAYARFSDGDVYVFDSIGSGFECCACRLPGRRWYTTKSRSEMIKHLMEHRLAGHSVPQGAIDDLQEEIKTIGDSWQAST